MRSGDALLFASRVDIDIIIRIHDSDFSKRILFVVKYVLIMKVRRTFDTNALILNEQRDYFCFGNPDASFIVVRQIIRDVMWGRKGILEHN